ncbi:hypothetical protein AB0I53_44155 [Saccharopolyspora sp. NPDC050389]|uniref:hypothetical protein n=1 Tax=Saccharopolyspora sp. NPDC050389 TaxID=3155516 RepID=UPI0033E5EBEA
MSHTIIVETCRSTWDFYEYQRIARIADRTVRVRIHRYLDTSQSYAVAEVLADNVTWTHLTNDAPENWLTDTRHPRTSRISPTDELGRAADRLVHRAEAILANPPGVNVSTTELVATLHALFATTYGYNGETTIEPDDIEWAQSNGYPLLIIPQTNGSITLTKAHEKQCAFITSFGREECSDCPTPLLNDRDTGGGLVP